MAVGVIRFYTTTNHLATCGAEACPGINIPCECRVMSTALYGIQDIVAHGYRVLSCIQTGLRQPGLNSTNIVCRVEASNDIRQPDLSWRFRPSDIRSQPVRDPTHKGLTVAGGMS